MSQKLYRHVLRDAWSVTWRHPALWVFGAFALFMGQSQFFYSLAGLFKLTSLSSSIISAAATPQWYIPLISPNSSAQLLGGILYALIAIVFMLAFVFMTIQSQGAIMAAGDTIFRQKLYSFKGAWHSALDHFWGVLGVLVIKVIAAFIVNVGILSLGFFLERWPSDWWPKVVFVIGFVVLALIDILITFVSLYATCYVVLEKQRIRHALTNAIGLFTKHWLASLEIGVIFLVCNAIASLVAFGVFWLLYWPLVYFIIVVHVITGMSTGLVFFTFGILVAAVWAIMAIYTTWFFMSIVVLFDHMISDTPVSKVVRFLQSLVSRT